MRTAQSHASIVASDSESPMSSETENVEALTHPHIPASIRCGRERELAEIYLRDRH